MNTLSSEIMFFLMLLYIVFFLTLSIALPLTLLFWNTEKIQAILPKLNNFLQDFTKAWGIRFILLFILIITLMGSFFMGHFILRIAE